MKQKTPGGWYHQLNEMMNGDWVCDGECDKEYFAQLSSTSVEQNCCSRSDDEPREENSDDAAIEPSVNEIDEIYKFLLDLTKADDAPDMKIARMLLTLDRVSNSINRKNEGVSDGV